MLIPMNIVGHVSMVYLTEDTDFLKLHNCKQLPMFNYQFENSNQQII